MLNLVQFLVKQGKLREKSCKIEKYSTEKRQIAGIAPVGEVQVGKKVEDKGLTEGITTALTGEKAPTIESNSSTEEKGLSYRPSGHAKTNNPVQSVTKPTPVAATTSKISRIPTPISDKIAEVMEKYAGYTDDGVLPDYCAVMCSHCLEEGASVKLAKRAESQFPGDSGWQFVCDGDHSDDKTSRVVQIYDVIEKNAGLLDIIQEPVNSVFVSESLKNDMVSKMAAEKGLLYSRGTGISGFVNTDDVELLNKVGFDISREEYSDLYNGEAIDLYSYMEKVAGVPREVARAVDKNLAFSGEYLKDMDFDVPKGYEVKGDLVCPIEKTADISPGSMQLNNDLLNMPTSIGGQERDWGAIVRDAAPSLPSVGATAFSSLSGSVVSKNLGTLAKNMQNKAVRGMAVMNYGTSEMSAQERPSSDALGKTIDRIGGIGGAISTIPHPVTRIGGTAISVGAGAVNFARDLNQSLQQHPFGQTLVGSIKQPSTNVNLNAPQHTQSGASSNLSQSSPPATPESTNSKSSTSPKPSQPAGLAKQSVEKSTKPGDKDYSEKETWGKLTKESAADPAQTILITGHSGAGKSTLGKLLAEKLNLPLHRVDSDPDFKNYVTNDKLHWKESLTPGTKEHTHYTNIVNSANRNTLKASDPAAIIEGAQLGHLSPAELAKFKAHILVGGDRDQSILQRIQRSVAKAAKKGVTFSPEEMDLLKIKSQHVADFWEPGISKFRQLPGVLHYNHTEHKIEPLIKKLQGLLSKKAEDMEKEASRSARRILEILKKSNPAARAEITKKLQTAHLAEIRPAFGPRTSSKINRKLYALREKMENTERLISRAKELMRDDLVEKLEGRKNLYERYLLPQMNYNRADALRKYERDFSWSLADIDAVFRKRQFLDFERHKKNRHFREQIKNMLYLDPKADKKLFKINLRKAIKENKNKNILAQYPTEQEGLKELLFTPHFTKTENAERAKMLEAFSADPDSIRLHGRNEEWKNLENYETVINRGNIADPSKRLAGAKYFIPQHESSPTTISTETLPTSAEGYMYKGGLVSDLRKARKLNEVAETEGMFYSGDPRVSSGYAGGAVLVEPAGFRKLRKYFVGSNSFESLADGYVDYFKPQVNASAYVQHKPTITQQLGGYSKPQVNVYDASQDKPTIATQLGGYLNQFVKNLKGLGNRFGFGKAAEDMNKTAETTHDLKSSNIRAKRARGEKAARPGDKDYPDKKTWNKLTKESEDMSLYEQVMKKLAESSPAWQRSEGKNPEGGLNAKGRASYKRETGGTLKAPVTESDPKGERAKRQNSFCSRMCGMKRVNTGSEAKSDPDSRINKSLRKWNCKCGEAYETEAYKDKKASVKPLESEILDDANYAATAPAQIKQGSDKLSSIKLTGAIFGQKLSEQRCGCGEAHGSLYEKVACVIKEAKGRCWEGYEPVPGKEPYSNDSCRPKDSKKKDKEKLAAANHPLKSSNIKAVGYNKEDGSLDVEFHSGGTYTYKDVPKSLFNRIKQVKSPGKFFHKHIRKDDKYSYSKLEKESSHKSVPGFPEPGTVSTFEHYPRPSHASNMDVIGNLIFGKNYIPVPQAGEDVSDAFRRMEGFRDRAEIQGNLLANHPIVQSLGLDQDKINKTVKGLGLLGVDATSKLSPVLGGDIGKASGDIAALKNNPAAMSQFKEAGEIPKKVRDAIFAGEKKLLSTFGKRGGNKAARNRERNHFKKWLDMGEEIVHPASDYTKQPNLPGM